MRHSDSLIRGLPVPEVERYVDSREVAEAMGVSVRTVKRWVAAGCPSQTWGTRTRRFRLSLVMAWAREQEAKKRVA